MSSCARARNKRDCAAQNYRNYSQLPGLRRLQGHSFDSAPAPGETEISGVGCRTRSADERPRRRSLLNGITPGRHRRRTARNHHCRAVPGIRRWPRRCNCGPRGDRLVKCADGNTAYTPHPSATVYLPSIGATSPHRARGPASASWTKTCACAVADREYPAVACSGLPVSAVSSSRRCSVPAFIRAESQC